MSVIDWTPGPRLREAQARGATLHMERVRDGVYRLSIDGKLVAVRETAQAAAYAIEDMLRVRGIGGA